MITPGKYRHLTQCSTPDGKFVILAIDHRGNLLKSLYQYQSGATEADLAQFKQDIIGHLSPMSSAVLTDPAYGIAPGILSGTLGGRTGLLMPIEVTNYEAHPSQTLPRVLKGWSVGKIKRVGASGVKLLLHYHPDSPHAQAKRDFVAQIIEACDRYDIPFFHEPIAHSLDPQKPLDNAELRQVVIESARTFSEMGIDVLKTEFPLNVKQESDETVWQEALAELNTACKVPWALLSAGTTYDIFRRQVELACQAGASGVIVGRAVWAEAISAKGNERVVFLATTAQSRMNELGEICRRYATNWRKKVARPEIDFNWYESYADL